MAVCKLGLVAVKWTFCEQYRN